MVLAQGPSPRAPVVRRSARSGARRVSPACPSPREASPSPSPPVRFDPQRRRLLGSPGGRVTAYTGAAGAWAHLSCCGPRIGSDAAQRIRVPHAAGAGGAPTRKGNPRTGVLSRGQCFSGVWVSDVQGWHLPSPRRAALGGGCRMSRRGLSPRQGGECCGTYAAGRVCNARRLTVLCLAGSEAKRDSRLAQGPNPAPSQRFHSFGMKLA